MKKCSFVENIWQLRGHTHHFIAVFPYLLNSWNRVIQVSGQLQPGTRFLKWVKLQTTS